MKNLFLVLVCVLGTSTIAFCQEKFSTDDLIGYWEPDKHSSQLVFWKDVDKNLQMVEFSTDDGKLLTLVSMKLINESLVVKTISEEKNWTTECMYNFIDKKTLQCIVKGAVDGTIIYTKIK
jgi:hypothetical protein